jgi:hypothetical protein
MIKDFIFLACMVALLWITTDLTIYIENKKESAKDE